MKSGLISLFLLTSLTACTSLKFEKPPASLLADCVETPVVMVVNKDLASAYQVRTRDLRTCNADKAALREWFK